MVEEEGEKGEEKEGEEEKKKENRKEKTKKEEKKEKRKEEEKSFLKIMGECCRENESAVKLIWESVVRVSCLTGI